MHIMYNISGSFSVVLLMGKPQPAENILKRILWWGERMPYWGDSFYADTMRYREETPFNVPRSEVAQSGV